MCQILLDEQVRQITTTVLMAECGASMREIAIAIEANQAYIEYLDWLKDHITFDESVTIEIDKTQIKFQNMDELSDFLVERMT